MKVKIQLISIITIGVVVYVILVAAQVSLVLTLDFGTSDLGLTI